MCYILKLTKITKANYGKKRPNNLLSYLINEQHMAIPAAKRRRVRQR